MSGAINPPVPEQDDSAEQPDLAQTIMDAITGQGADQDDQKRIPRNPPEPDEPRRRLVKRWVDRIKADKKHHDRAFRRMRRNQEFAHGDQWDRGDTATTGDADSRYVVNIALRHVQQRTASLYATNPKVIVKKRERLLSSVWDGDMLTLQAAQQKLQQAAMAQAQEAQLSGVPVVPGQAPPGLDPNILAVLADAKNVQTYDKMIERVSKTLELLWEYNVAEQTHPFKSMMKLTVRRAIVTGVGYVKLGFQRKLRMRPEIETRIADHKERLVTIQRLSDDISDGEVSRESAEAEQLKLAIQALMKEPQLILREGLLFDYPDSTAIIPHKKCKSLRGFLGGDWVTQEYFLTRDEIQEVYNVDVGTRMTAYSVDRLGDISERPSTRSEDDDAEEELGAVWEAYSRKDGLVYVVCDGYPDFLQEPAEPEVYLDQFFPWFPIVLNEGYHHKEIYPKSDIDLLRDMQLELNRARQGLREHRRANRPKMVTSAGMLEDADKEKLATHPANALIELAALPPGQKCEDLLQPMKMPPIDPAVYDTNATFEDILRVLGQDQASSGQTTSATATETAVAQAAQHTDLASCIDDQDDLLSALALAAGKILMMNVSAETVEKVVGPGAAWPELTKQDVMEAIYLTVQAGSTGRPNRQQEVQNAQILFPMLQRVPGINPEWMARELIKRLDDRLDLTDAFIAGMPSMDALNRIQGTVATPPPQDPQNPAAGAAQAAGPGGPPMPAAPPVPPPGAVPGQPPRPPGAGGAPPMAPPMGGAHNDPTAQGNMGANNAPAPPPTNGLLGPRTPPVPGANGLMPGQGGGPKLRPQGGVPVP